MRKARQRMTRAPVKRPFIGVRTPLAEFTAALARYCRQCSWSRGQQSPRQGVGDGDGLDEGAKYVGPTYCQHLLVHVHWLPPSCDGIFCHIHIALVIMIVITINSNMILTKGFGDGGRIDDGDHWHNNQGQAKSGEGGDARLNKTAVHCKD